MSVQVEIPACDSIPNPIHLGKTKIACGHCRKLKIRCDGGKPACGHCVRLYKECSYTATQRRRSTMHIVSARPLRTTPRGRQSTSQTNLGCSASTSAGVSPGISIPSTQTPRNLDDVSPVLNGGTTIHGLELVEHSPFEIDRQANTSSSQYEPAAVPLTDGTSSRSFSRPQPSADSGIESTAAPGAFYASGNVEEHEDADHEQTLRSKPHPCILFIPADIGHAPSANFVKQAWWDTALSFYGHDRQIAARQISTSLMSILSVSQSWLSFLNVPRFSANLHNPTSRMNMQPAFVFALLALSALREESKADQERCNFARAFRLRDAAQSALDASVNTSWIEPSLAYAAYVLVVFETCLHPLHNNLRSRSAIRLADALVRSLALTCADSTGQRTSIIDPMNCFSSSFSVGLKPSDSCSCWTIASSASAMRATNAGYQESTAELTSGEAQKEESKLMVWSAMLLLSAYTSNKVEFDQEYLPLFITDSPNYLPPSLHEGNLPGLHFENPPHHYLANESFPTLYRRLRHLWCDCTRMRHLLLPERNQNQYPLNTTEINQTLVAARAWVEISAIEWALARHDCWKHELLIHVIQGWSLSIRLLIAHNLSRCAVHPATWSLRVACRQSITEWMQKQGATVDVQTKELAHSVADISTIFRSPSFVYGLETQISRCLALSQADSSLGSLKLCKPLFAIYNHLSSLNPWPARLLWRRSLELHKRFTAACLEAGVSYENL